MGNRSGLCWTCSTRATCKAFNKDPNANVVECGRYASEITFDFSLRSLFEDYTDTHKLVGMIGEKLIKDD